jgi:hypothetical protein
LLEVEDEDEAGFEDVDGFEDVSVDDEVPDVAAAPSPLELGAAGVAASPSFEGLGVASSLLVSDPFEAGAIRRSIFAQPDPLNSTVGATTAFRTGPPPQLLQTVGPSAKTPWTTSNRVPHAAHA